QPVLIHNPVNRLNVIRRYLIWHQESRRLGFARSLSGRRRGGFLLFKLLLDLLVGGSQRRFAQLHSHAEEHTEVHTGQARFGMRVEVQDWFCASKNLEAGKLPYQSPGDFIVGDHRVVVNRDGRLAMEGLPEVLHEGVGGGKCPAALCVVSAPCIEGIDFPVRRSEVSLPSELAQRVDEHHQPWCHYVREGHARQEVEYRLGVKLIKFAELHVELKVAAPADRNILLSAVPN